MTAEDRNLIRGFKKRIDSPSTDSESCSKLTMGEFISPICKMKRQGAAGLDGIASNFLKALGPIAFQELLEIFLLTYISLSIFVRAI